MLRRSITPITDTLRDPKCVNMLPELFLKCQALRKTQIRRIFRSKATNGKYEKLKEILEQHFSISKSPKLDNENKAKLDNCKKCEKILEEIFGKTKENYGKDLATTVKEKGEELITKIETIKDAKLVETDIKTDSDIVPPKVLGNKLPNVLLTKRKECVLKIKHNVGGKEFSSLFKGIGQFGEPIDGQMKTSSGNKCEKIIHSLELLNKPKEARDNLNKEKATYRVQVFRQKIKNSKATKQFENVNAISNRPYKDYLTKNENTEIQTFHEHDGNNESTNLKLGTKVNISDMQINYNETRDFKKSPMSFFSKVNEKMAQSSAVQPKSGGETIEIKEECFRTSNTGNQTTNSYVKNPKKDKTIVATTVSLAPPKSAETEESSSILLSEKVSLNELLKRVREKNKKLPDANLRFKCPSTCSPPSSKKCPPSPCNRPSTPRCPPPRSPTLTNCPPRCPPRCPPPQRKSPCHPPSRPVCPPPRPICPPPQRKSPCHPPSRPVCPPPRPICPPPQRESPCHPPSRPVCPPPQRKCPPCQPNHPSKPVCPPPSRPQPPTCPPVSRPSHCPPLPKATPTPQRPVCPPPCVPKSPPTCPPRQKPACSPPPKCQPKCPSPCKKFRSNSLPTDFIILYSQPKIRVTFEPPAVELVEDQLKIKSKNYDRCIPIPC